MYYIHFKHTFAVSNFLLLIKDTGFVKKAITILSFVLIFLHTNINAQSVHEILGESYNISAGIHSGIFDSNHNGAYPLNIGVTLQYDYFPDIRNNFYFGGQVGSFFAFSDTDKYGRKTRDVFVDVTFYPGISFPLEKSTVKSKNPGKVVKYLKDVRRFNVSLGFTAVFPTRKRSEGSGVNTGAIKPGIGFALKASYELKNRISVFLSTTRINRDLDGYAFHGNTPNKSNKNQVTYIHKIGVLYSFINK